MADASGQYRHGVLIGNWSEDKYGHELMTLDHTRGLPDHVSTIHQLITIHYIYLISSINIYHCEHAHTAVCEWCISFD